MPGVGQSNICLRKNIWTAAACSRKQNLSWKIFPGDWQNTLFHRGGFLAVQYNCSRNIRDTLKLS